MLQIILYSQKRIANVMIEEFIKQLEKNNLIFERITDELIHVKEYITQNELDSISAIIDKASQKDWETIYMESVKAFCIEKFNRSDIDNLVAEGKFEITQNWTDKNLNFGDNLIERSYCNKLGNIIQACDSSLFLSGFSTIQRMQTGVELKAHFDQHTDPSVRYAAILYLNDNYKNGELFFENLNISIKPNAKDLLFFPGNEKYKHGVRPVGLGPIRYVIVGFIKEKDFYKINKY